MAIHVNLPESETNREAIHDSIGHVLADDGEKAAKAIDGWLEKPDLEADTRSTLLGLKHYALGDLESAKEAVHSLVGKSVFARLLAKAVEARAVQGTRAQGIEILKVAAAERIENTIAEDQAWFKALRRGLGGGDISNPEQRRIAIASFFKKLEERLVQTPLPLSEALSTTVPQGIYEKEIKALLLQDPLFAQLTDIL
ncbi:MAG: hypothetical protein K8R69_01990, partial [Deltaproteobacteria bacterium]|nr:hypothetical protein [Deltaproteobacteria bacterium]